jgi:hypothetical protein
MKYILPDGTKISEEIFFESLKLIQPLIQQERDNQIIEQMKAALNNMEDNEFKATLKAAINNKDQNEERI